MIPEEIHQEIVRDYKERVFTLNIAVKCLGLHCYLWRPCGSACFHICVRPRPCKIVRRKISAIHSSCSAALLVFLLPVY